MTNLLMTMITNYSRRALALYAATNAGLIVTAIRSDRRHKTLRVLSVIALVLYNAWHAWLTANI